MSILVGYVSKHGATQQIAERVAERLRATGVAVDVRPLKAVGEPAAYEAFVIGSAVYFGSWMKEANAFVRRNQAVLASRPVWLFSSGPLGTATTDTTGRDVRDAAIPKEIADFTATIRPLDHHVFFGALDHAAFGLTERLLWALPASHKLLIEGDFRDWSEVDVWAEQIAHELAPVPAGGR
jgi:menaquinone-dependent protoporphyrinogen oxidase